MYVSLNAIIYCFFDENNYLNRTRPEILDAETIERFENVLGTEETNISQQISVSTSLYLASNWKFIEQLKSF